MRKKKQSLLVATSDECRDPSLRHAEPRAKDSRPVTVEIASSNLTAGHIRRRKPRKKVMPPPPAVHSGVGYCFGARTAVVVSFGAMVQPAWRSVPSHR